LVSESPASCGYLGRKEVNAQGLCGLLPIVNLLNLSRPAHAVLPATSSHIAGALVHICNDRQSKEPNKQRALQVSSCGRHGFGDNVRIGTRRHCRDALSVKASTNTSKEQKERNINGCLQQRSTWRHSVEPPDALTPVIMGTTRYLCRL
jgi:hypothetical protein